MGRTYKAFGVGVGLLVVACGAERAPDARAEEDDEELQALLHDAPLNGATRASDRTVSAIAPPRDFAPQRVWSFDDCSPERAELFNTGSRGGETAFRSVGVACVPGTKRGAIALAAREDLVHVPDQPYFTFGEGVTVGGWFQPTAIDRTQTLFRKRDKGTSAFALVLHRGRWRFVINLGNGTAASVSAPGLARIGEAQHVAASYDGAALRLYVDGRQVAARDVVGSIPPGPGPLLIGNDGSERRFNGVIDEAVFELGAVPPERVLQLTCFPEQPTVVVTPSNPAPTAPDVPVTFDIAVTNHNPAACLPMDFALSISDVPPMLNLDESQRFASSPPVASGGTTHFSVTGTPYDVPLPEEGGSIDLEFLVASHDWEFALFSWLSFPVAEPAGCHVSKSRELFINDPTVIHDRFRSRTEGPSGDARVGVWTFKHLVEQMAPTPGEAPAMVEAMFRSYAAPQLINGVTVPPRPGVERFLAIWPRTPSGALDLNRAPIRLRAIVNRIDLRDLDHGNAGQGSFVFGLTQDGFDMQATLIVEYRLPARSEADVMAWAQAFHALGALELDSEPYNAALQAITESFVRRGARPDGVNGSAFHALRTDVYDDASSNLEFREFRLSPVTGRLVPSPLERTPDQRFNGSPALRNFILANRDAIIAGTHTVPDQLDGQPFRAGSAFHLNTSNWSGSGIDSESRHAFALATCNGCHSQETGIFIHHVAPFSPSQRVEALSPFLRGVTAADPFTGEPRVFNDMLRRKLDLEAIVCPTTPTVSLRHGLNRVH